MLRNTTNSEQIEHNQQLIKTKSKSSKDKGYKITNPGGLHFANCCKHWSQAKRSGPKTYNRIGCPPVVSVVEGNRNDQKP